MSVSAGANPPSADSANTGPDTCASNAPDLYEDAIVKGVFCWCLAILIALGYGYRRAVKHRSRLYP